MAGETFTPSNQRFRFRRPTRIDHPETSDLAEAMQRFADYAPLAIDISAHVWSNVNIALTVAAFKVLPFTTIIEDPRKFWNGTTALIVPPGLAGRYMIETAWSTNDSIGSQLGTVITVNSIAVTRRYNGGGAANAYSDGLSTETFLNVGDKVEVAVFTATATSLRSETAAAGNAQSPFLRLTRIAVKG